MADRKLSKMQMAFIVVIVLIIPFIIVFQLVHAPDITLDFEADDTFENTCFLGENECTYIMFFPDFELREDATYWWILGENVWCEKIERTVAEPVADPVGVITEETEIKCNNVVMFDKDEWTRANSIAVPDIVCITEPCDATILGGFEVNTFTKIGQ